MNHPSDYMNNYQDELSSDSSNPTVKIPPFPKNKPVRSLHQPHLRPPKKPAKPNPPPKKEKPSGGKMRKGRSSSQYLILGDSYFQSGKVRELSKRFVEEQQLWSTRVMQVQRMKRKEQRSITKIETYIRTFVQAIAIANAIRRLDTQRKLTLYRMLKEEEFNLTKEEPIEEYFQIALQKVEQLTSHYQQQFPHKGRAITRWKNHRLHQLSSAKHFLAQQDCDLQSQLTVLQQEQFFPELRQQAEELHSCIAIHLTQQNQVKKEEEDRGVIWVLQRLHRFIIEEEEVIDSILMRLQESAQPLLEDELFILFQREVIGSSADESQQEEQRYIHMFNKAVFDLINQAAPSLLPLCPHSPVDEVLAWLFKQAPKYHPEDIIDGECLLRIDEVIFDGLIEEALWDFLEWL